MGDGSMGGREVIAPGDDPAERQESAQVNGERNDQGDAFGLRGARWGC